MMVLYYPMTIIESHPETRAQTHIDRCFYPDLVKYKMGAAPLAGLERLGIKTVGRPFPGLPDTRGAIWPGTTVNSVGELAVIVTVNRPRAKSPETASTWFAGCVPTHAQQEELDEETLGIYAGFAEHTTSSPGTAIVLAHLLLLGREATPPELLNHRISL